MRVSLIITTYNNPGALGRVLDGIASQSRLPDEVIVADDGSGPDTRSLVEGFKARAPFSVKHVWQDDRGFRLAKVRNEAVKVAMGDYLVILDGDCVPNRHYVSDHLALAERGFFVQGKRVLLSQRASGTVEARDVNSTPALMRLFLGGQLSNSHHLIRMPFFPALRNDRLKGIKGCSQGVFREDVIAVNGFNEDMEGWGREDSEFAVRLFKLGIKRKEHPFMAICFHIWHSDNPDERICANEEILARTIAAAEYRCTNGIEKVKDDDRS